LLQFLYLYILFNFPRLIKFNISLPVDFDLWSVYAFI